MTVAHLNGHMTAGSPVADLDPEVSHPELRVERDLSRASVPDMEEADQGTEMAAAPDRDAAFRAFIASVGSPPVTPYPVVTAHDLLTRVPAQETAGFLVEGILPAGELVIFDALPKAGKGLISIDLLCSIARGEPFLGMEVRQGGALYVAAEERAEEIASRLRRRLGSGDAEELNLGVLDASGFGERTLRLEDPGDVSSLAETIRQSDCSVVVLDTLRELHRCTEDLADEMAPLLRKLRGLAHCTGVTIIVNHHQNKSGGSRGSGAIPGAGDTTWSFSRNDAKPAEPGLVSPPRGALVVEGRRIPKHEIVIQFGSDGRWNRA